MTFQITTQFFNTMDNVILNYVSTQVALVAQMATPVVGIAMTMMFLMEGMQLLYADGGGSLGQFFQRYIRTALIVGIAGVGGFYQTTLAHLAVTLPDQVSQALVTGSASSSGSVANTIDQCLELAIKSSFGMWDHSSFFSGGGIVLMICAFNVLVLSVLLCAMMAGILAMSKFLLGIAICFGPAFIFCLLFKPTKGLFEKWMGTVVNHAIVVVICAMSYGMIMQFFKNGLNGVKSVTEGNFPALNATASLGLLAAMSFFIIMKIPSIAAHWGSGVAGHIPDITRALNSGGGGSGKALSAPSSDAGAGLGSKVADAATAAASGGAGAAKAATNAIKGYARGSAK
ncbi:type IV secretion system protein [Entomobacter blattae]|uniref:TrbL/VirB6 plasmid conjugal transfer protein n=1 Tax=Entomobacter blattae TaxID=2762277 RepID=A0A7H1NRQ2_9PROT|nr:type IV secretion system protein [Entomobacter blattae]QNT78462.1 TrbL/VirB6 plasmid conjugal transfer protein [Entomobacter blattae]